MWRKEDGSPQTPTEAGVSGGDYGEGGERERWEFRPGTLVGEAGIDKVVWARVGRNGCGDLGTAGAGKAKHDDTGDKVGECPENRGCRR